MIKNRILLLFVKKLRLHMILSIEKMLSLYTGNIMFCLK